MFEDSLVESSGRFRTNRGKTTTLAFVIQFTILGVLILIPLIYTEALPSQMMSTFLVAPPPPPPPPPPAAMVKVTKIETEMENGALRTPTKIPEKVKMVKEEEVWLGKELFFDSPLTGLGTRYVVAHSMRAIPSDLPDSEFHYVMNL